MRGNSDQPNTTHSGLPLRHGIQNESRHDRGYDRGAVYGASQGPLRARTGVPVATMHMSGSHGNHSGIGPATAQGEPGGLVVKGGEGAPGEALERDAKRQRSAEWGGVGQIQSEEGDWASACFAEGDMPSVFEHEMGWQ